MSKTRNSNRKNEETALVDVAAELAALEAPEIVVLEDAAPVAKTRKPKRLTEEQLVEKYPHAIAGTLIFETEGHHAGKQTIEAMLACGHIARVATSDLFQVKACPDCKKASKVAKAETAEAKKTEAVAKKPLTGAAYNKKSAGPAVVFIPEANASTDTTTNEEAMTEALS